MARYQGTTAERGLGAQHRKARIAALAALAPGTPCPGCGQPMYLRPGTTAKDAQPHLDLDHVTPRALGGTNGPKRLMCRRCNRGMGAVLGNKLRARRRRSRRW